MVTLAVGCLTSTIVNVAMSPFSDVSPEIIETETPAPSSSPMVTVPLEGGVIVYAPAVRDRTTVSSPSVPGSLSGVTVTEVEADPAEITTGVVIAT